MSEAACALPCTYLWVCLSQSKRVGETSEPPSVIGIGACNQLCEERILGKYESSTPIDHISTLYTPSLSVISIEWSSEALKSSQEVYFWMAGFDIVVSAFPEDLKKMTKLNHSKKLEL